MNQTETRNDALKPLHIASVGRHTYGIGSVVLSLTDAQRACAARPTIWSTDSSQEAEEIRQRHGIPDEGLLTYPVFGPARAVFSPQMERTASSREGEAFDVLHQHGGLWTGQSRVSQAWRRQFARPTVVAAHGELDPYALRRSRWKKRLAQRAFASENLHRASCLHALAESELANYRDFGLKNPVAVIPNGVDKRWLESAGSAERFRERFSIPSDKRLMIFFSRVTPKKGLPMLLDSIASVRSRLSDWMLLIIGPDEFDHVRELKAQIASLGIGGLVRFTGPVFGDDRRDVFEAAELFVLPTHSEGAPMAILEALGAGVPVMTTRGAPCSYLVERDCGWWTEISTGAIQEALCNALDRTSSELTEMGARGRALIAERFVWPIMAEMTIRLYHWLFGEGERPDFVIL